MSNTEANDMWKLYFLFLLGYENCTEKVWKIFGVFMSKYKYKYYDHYLSYANIYFLFSAFNGNVEQLHCSAL